MDQDVFYIRDSGGYRCEECAVERLKSELEREHRRGEVDAALRVLAVYRWAEDAVPSVRFLHDEIGGWWPGGANYRWADRKTQAHVLVDEICSQVSTDYIYDGVMCDDCHEELVEPYIRCRSCDEDGYLSVFPMSEKYDDIDWDGGRPSVAFCKQCEGEVLLDDDGRGYVLRYRGDGIYTAGCREFTVEEALAHWGDPEHYTRQEFRQWQGYGDREEWIPAELLFSHVLRHAMAEWRLKTMKR